MALPAFIGFLIFFIAPLIMSISYSFTDWSMMKPNPEFVGLKNYEKLLNDTNTMAAIEHSIRYAVVITVVQNALAILFAVLLNRQMFMARVLKSVFFFPAVISILVVGYLFKYIMTSADYGMLNNVIQFFGGSPVNWLGDGDIALYSVLATQVWQWTGWAMVIYIANLKSIDPTYYEAAKIDGASSSQAFWRITLPLLYPAVSFNVLMSLIGGLKVFDIVFAMTKGGPGFATDTIMTTMIKVGFNSGRYGFACAFAVVFLVIVFAVTQIVTFLFNRWEARVS
ncbi:MAG: sugar ABC transporter permease [Oscillospiraceae bacterium]|nr:sugar ABC transporter permease [Oscillospiraceae bacterium]